MTSKRKARQVNRRRAARTYVRWAAIIACAGFQILCRPRTPRETKAVETGLCSTVSEIRQRLKRTEAPFEKLSSEIPLCGETAQLFMHILIPFYGEPPVRAIESVREQVFKRKRMWVLEDGGEHLPKLQWRRQCGGLAKDITQPPSKLSKEYFGDMSAVDDLLCFHSETRFGPARTRYVGLQLIDAFAGANDVVVLLDGDDALARKSALQLLNDAYLQKKSWCTYGSYVGAFSKQTKPFTTDIPFKPRVTEWVYGHMRTFKVHLIKHLSVIDFTDGHGAWLQKATDRGLFYRIMELSGPNRTSYIREITYSYNSNDRSTRAQVPKDTQTQNLKHVQSLTPSEPLLPQVHIILVVWRRTFLLNRQIESIATQTIQYKRKLVLHIVNNNPSEKHNIEQMVQKERQLWHKSIQIHVQHLDKNIGAFQRFFYACELWQTIVLDEFVLLDDDQIWPRTFVEDLLTELQPKSSISWYGKIFNNTNAGVMDYWRDSYLTMDDIKHGLKQHLKTLSYLGPGGSAFDSNICTMSHLIRNVFETFPEYRDFDDIWMSYIMDALLGWKQIRLSASLPTDLSDPSSWTFVDKYFHRMSRISRVATYTKSIRRKRAHFSMLQTEFKWNVFCISSGKC